MDPIYEAYSNSINEQGPSKHFSGTSNKDQKFADLASSLYDSGAATEDRVNQAWETITVMYDLEPQKIPKAKIKQFLADLEEVEVADEDGNVIHVTTKRIKKHMKKWLS